MSDWIKILLGYLLAINLVTFVFYGVDKRRAQKEKWRIPERTLLFLPLIGGSVGALAGMYGFRHKTKHISFVVGVPVILLVQVALAVYLYYFK